MEQISAKEKVSVILPVYNEEKTVKYVIDSIKKCHLIDEIIVVNDCSTDSTLKIVENIKGIKIINNTKNLGKGGSLEKGAKTAKNRYLLFCDGDYTLLPKKSLDQIIKPVLFEGYDMFIGVGNTKFNRNLIKKKKNISTSFFISGLRAIKKSKWETLPKVYKKRFRIEIGLSYYMNRYNSKWGFTLVNFKHLKKEEKHGEWKGFFLRCLMYWDIGVAYGFSRSIGNISYYIKKFFRLI